MTTPSQLKENLLMPGDTVRVPVGRGWKKAKIVKKLGDSIVRIKFRSMGLIKEVDIDISAIMTEEEVKAFSKSGGNTQIVRRQGTTMMGNTSNEELNPTDEEIIGKNNGKRKRFLGVL